jgi:hypoxanthine phosphoribosyltransferase
MALLRDPNSSRIAQAQDAALWVTSEQYDDLIERLAVQIQQSDFRFEQIVCLARGGMRIGDVLSRLFKVPLAILATSSYRGSAGAEQGAIDIAPHITSTAGPLRGNILLVDDMVDSGVTLAAVQERLVRSFPQVAVLKTAVLWQKAASVVRPDFVVSILGSDPWIHQPFERYDTDNLASLVDKWSKPSRPAA